MPRDSDATPDPAEVESAEVTDGRDDAFETDDGDLVIYDTRNAAAFVYSDHWVRPEA
jgi:hypothetical protein